jgi:hypothetical protein
MTTRIEKMDATSTRVVIGNINPARELDSKKLVFRIGGGKPRTIEVPVSVPVDLNSAETDHPAN